MLHTNIVNIPAGKIKDGQIKVPLWGAGITLAWAPQTAGHAMNGAKASRQRASFSSRVRRALAGLVEESTR